MILQCYFFVPWLFVFLFLFLRCIFNKKSNNDIIEKDDYITKIEYPLNENSLDNVAKKFNNVYEKYLKDTNTNIYFSIIPDKNYYLIGEDENYLSLDYNKLVTDITEKTNYMKYIDIFPLLSIEDYYNKHLYQ